jgi:hypothetical protein
MAAPGSRPPSGFESCGYVPLKFHVLGREEHLPSAPNILSLDIDAQSSLLDRDFSGQHPIPAAHRNEGIPKVEGDRGCFIHYREKAGHARGLSLDGVTCCSSTGEVNLVRHHHLSRNKSYAYRAKGRLPIHQVLVNSKKGPVNYGLFAVVS